MAQPLRKIFQKNLLRGGEARSREGVRASVREGGEGRRVRRPRTLDLSGAAACALGLALVAAVGWAFFMGYLVGRGDHPGRGVESVAGLLRPGAPAKDGDAGQAPVPGVSPGQLPGEEALAGQAPDVAAAPLPAGEPAGAEAAAAAAPTPATPPAPATSGPGAYPFNRPQGEGLAAWGISPEAPQAQASPPAPGQTTARAPAQARKAHPPVPAEPRFDYLFQAAAFKGPVDAERLRGRLTGAGLRASVRQSGKVRLVLVSLRGTAQEAQRVRGQLAGMGLGRPIQLEKKPVAERTGGKGRPRSAP